jgi:hypothetical protein
VLGTVCSMVALCVRHSSVSVTPAACPAPQLRWLCLRGGCRPPAAPGAAAPAQHARRRRGAAGARWDPSAGAQRIRLAVGVPTSAMSASFRLQRSVTAFVFVTALPCGGPPYLLVETWQMDAHGQLLSRALPSFRVRCGSLIRRTGQMLRGPPCRSRCPAGRAGCPSLSRSWCCRHTTEAWTQMQKKCIPGMLLNSSAHTCRR